MRAVDIEVAASGRSVVVTTQDGRRRELSAHLLWSECPSAIGRVRRAKGMSTAPVGLTIMFVQKIGIYGVNVGFSDGHDRGIYPWEYLITLAERPSLESS